MTVISCIKQVRDLDIVLKDDWVVAEDGRSINIDYANRIMNTFDETSLELMLRLKDLEEDLHTKVVTIGSSHSEAILRKALALGVDDAIRIEASDEIDFNPMRTASLLKDVIKKETDVQFVFCGRQADNGSHGLTGQLLAEMLGWPCITMVSDMKKAGKGYKISRMLEGGIEQIYVKGPIVLSVSQSENKLLRMVGLRAMLEAKKKPIRQLQADSTQDDSSQDDSSQTDAGSIYELNKIVINKPEKHCLFIEERKDESKTDQLLTILKTQVQNEAQ